MCLIVRFLLLLVGGGTVTQIALQSKSSHGTLWTVDMLGKQCVQYAGAMGLNLRWFFKSIGPVATYFALASDHFLQTLIFIV